MTAKIIVGLGFGDEGKGTTVDRMSRDQSAHTVVRINGGAQAAHHVVLPDGTWHRFAQFGSGTFAGAKTFLSRYVMVYPHYMNMEADELEKKMGINPMDLMYVDRECLITTPYHQAMNRAREKARGEGSHGSCGVGIGETARYALETPTLAPTVADCGRQSMRDKLEVLRAYAFMTVPEDDPIMKDWSVKDLAREYDNWRRLVKIVDGEHLRIVSDLSDGNVIFEGAQGVLLDEHRGFHPHTTWSTTTPTNALTLAREAGIEPEVVGVCRSYMTRHGNGPFPTESPDLTKLLKEKHNATGEFMGAWRSGHLDLVMLKYAAACCEQLDGIVVTHTDRPHKVAICDAYMSSDERHRIEINPSPYHDLDYQERLAGSLLASLPVYTATITGERSPSVISEALDVPVVMTSYGPTWEAKSVARMSPFAGSSLA